MKHAAPLLILTVLASLACAQELVSPQDSSKHRVQFVTVEDSIRLEVCGAVG